MKSEFRGVYVIPVTPFTDAGELDEPSLRRWVRFVYAAGVHGLVAPVNASSFASLTDDERQRVVEVIVDECTSTRENARRVPFVAGVTGASKESAVLHARHAKQAGADAVIAMPPYVQKAGENEIVDYYRAVSEACELPVWIQNFVGPVGTPMTPRLLARIFNEVDGVAYLKEETEQATHVITAVQQLTDQCKGIMGGKGGRFFLNEYQRGACGTMPAGHVPELMVAVWNALEAGNFADAWQVWKDNLPLLNFEQLYGGVTVYAAVLHRRGIISTPHVRQPGAPQLDAIDLAELDRILAEIKPRLINWA